MHYIVMSRSDYAHPDNAILMHEHEHIRRHHSWDVVLVSILSALQWFNPAMWMLRSDLQTVHEYEADAAVLSGGVDARQYQLMLVRKAMAAAGYSVVNSINHSTLKQRITMMNTHKSKKHVCLRAFYVIPIVAASLVASARTVTDYKIVESASQTAPKAAATVQQLIAESEPTISANTKSEDKKVVNLKPDDKSKSNNPLIIIDGKQCTYNALEELSPNDIQNITVLKDPDAIKKYGEKGKNGVIVINIKNVNGPVKATAKANDKVFAAAEKMPVFPGGPSELKRYISSNLQYPDVARRWKTQGRILVSFIVSADGSVSDPQIVANYTSGEAVSNAYAAEDGGKADWAKEELRRKGVQEAQAALAQEAIRVVGAMPKWEPATQDGKPVSVKYNIPVTFRIQ